MKSIVTLVITLATLVLVTSPSFADTKTSVNSVPTLTLQGRDASGIYTPIATPVAVTSPTVITVGTNANIVLDITKYNMFKLVCDTNTPGAVTASFNWTYTVGSTTWNATNDASIAIVYKNSNTTNITLSLPGSVSVVLTNSQTSYRMITPDVELVVDGAVVK